jgi:hypothetical protein
MRLRIISTVTLAFIAGLPIALSSCGSDESNPGGGTGAVGVGGAGAAIGGNSAGGSKPSTGGSSSGATANGGASPGGTGTGGVTTGGTTTGGVSTGAVGAGGATGGTSPGGAGAAGAAGGAGTSGAGNGGSPAGGSSGSGKWGEVENPGAGCTVGPMPSVSSLMANAKLPDPFKKMDGMRITTKSEWRCRREEILRQAYAFIYGDKPVPEKSAVTGTVSSSSITVQATGTMGMASFNVSVDMNGATAPAPAIIGYGGLTGMPVPSGVAVITFNPIESQGASGAKNGPFYSAYGSNHPAGYLAAQAWQVSRVLDVLEQNPGTIDPYRVGVTGCSRWGKGAFVAGVLDNRIALTIPVESGLGGTVGLRLVETMDSYSGSEWPFHGISYVRWLSEVALGQFTTGNSASADNTDKLPVDMHEMMGLIAPRGLYIVDNPSTMYNGLDRNSAWATAKVGKMIFEALGVGDHMSYQGASGSHCMWRSQYTASLTAMVDRFLKKNESAMTGNVATDLPNPPDHLDRIDWEPPMLSGDL